MSVHSRLCFRLEKNSLNYTNNSAKLSIILSPSQLETIDNWGFSSDFLSFSCCTTVFLLGFVWLIVHLYWSSTNLMTVKFVMVSELTIMFCLLFLFTLSIRCKFWCILGITDLNLSMKISICLRNVYMIFFIVTRACLFSGELFHMLAFWYLPLMSICISNMNVFLITLYLID